jgi:hypothetical protein
MNFDLREHPSAELRRGWYDCMMLPRKDLKDQYILKNDLFWLCRAHFRHGLIFWFCDSENEMICKRHLRE